MDRVTMRARSNLTECPAVRSTAKLAYVCFSRARQVATGRFPPLTKVCNRLRAVR
jgi:hypothetical protein